MAGITAIKKTGVKYPDGRTGFFSAGLAQGDSISPETSTSGGSHGGGYGRKEGETAAQDMDNYTFNTSIPNPNNIPDRKKLAAINAEEEKQRQAQKAFEERLKKEKEQREKALGTTGPLKINYKTSYFDKFKNKIIQKALDRNKLLAMKKLNLTKTFNPFANVPDWAKNLTEEELVGINSKTGLPGIAITGPYLGLQKTKPDVNKFAAGKDLLGRVFEAQSILDNTGKISQTEFEDAFYGPKGKPYLGGGGEGNDPIIYTNTDDTTDDDTTDDETTYDYRFGDPNANTALDVTLGYYAANGGRVPRAFGGIMDTATGRKAYGLGSIFKSVAKAAKKVLKSPIGQAALLYAGGTYLGGMKAFGGTGNLSFMERLASPGNIMNVLKPSGWSQKNILNPLLRSYDKDLGKYTGLSPFKGIMNLSALPFAMQALGIGQPKQDPSLMASRKDTGLIDPLTGKEGTMASMRENIELAKLEAGDDPVKLDALNQAYNNMLFTNKPYENYGLYANGGRIGFAFGGQPLPHDPTKPVNPWTPKPQGPVLPNRAGGYGKQRVLAEEGGLMNLGGMEKDYRAEGGFVPIGKAEKADDVPARLSVNEFVFTADAVRNAGGGDIDKGAEVMENMMKNLEKGGRVSEESQGNTGAQEMFSVSERIGEVI